MMVSSAPRHEAPHRRAGWLRRVEVVLIALAVTFATGGTLAAPESASRLVERGIETYQQAQDQQEPATRRATFLTAARLFEQASATAPDQATAALLTNTGTAFVQAGELGRAMLQFRRALVLDPAYDRASRAAAEVRTTLPISVPIPDQDPGDSVFAWHTRATDLDRQTVMLLTFVLFCAVFGASLLAGAAALRWLSLPPAALFLTAATSLLVASSEESAITAVVTAPEVVARTADSFNSTPRYEAPLPAGTEVEIAETRDRWLRVRLANSEVAWLPARSVTRVDARGLPTP